MTRAVDRVDRLLIGLLALVLLAAGALGLVVSFGVFGAGRARRPVLDPGITAFASSHDWFCSPGAMVRTTP